jgi:hypothetical protein
MDLVEIVRRYQHFDRGTGSFTTRRSLRRYARHLGVTPSTLSRFYAGLTDAPWYVLRAFLRAYPEASYEVVEFLRSDYPVLAAEVAVA